MNFQTLALATLIVAFGVTQYTLMVQAIRDLIRRPRVRGGNKMSWALLILCVPIAGAFLYSWMGPTSFLRHRTATATRQPTESVLRRADQLQGPRPSNVTPLRPTAESSVRGRTAQRRPGLTRSRAHNTGTGTSVHRMRRTGS